MHPVLVQTIYYAIVVLLAVGVLSFVLRGFFWKFVKVRMSFGKYVLVKVKAINRDYFRVGRIHDTFLVYKAYKHDKRLAIQEDSQVFYRSLGCTWVDVDEQKNAILNANYSGVEGFDAEKYNDLYLRALYKPQIADTKEKIIIGAIIILGIMIIATLWLSYTHTKDLSYLKLAVDNIKVGTVTPGGL